MIRILFVCHGNICRSPMAEFVFKALASQKGVGDRFAVESAATTTDEIWGDVGNPVYPPAKAELARHGITQGVDRKRARLLTSSDLDRYDLLVGMDQANIREMTRIVGGDPKGKIVKLLDYADGGDVADPWYTRRFDVAYRDIDRGCRALLDTLLMQGIE